MAELDVCYFHTSQRPFFFVSYRLLTLLLFISDFFIQFVLEEIQYFESQLPECFGFILNNKIVDLNSEAWNLYYIVIHNRNVLLIDQNKSAENIKCNHETHNVKENDQSTSSFFLHCKRRM